MPAAYEFRFRFIISEFEDFNKKKNVFFFGSQVHYRTVFITLTNNIGFN